MKIIHFTDSSAIPITEDTAKNITGRMVIGKNDGAEHCFMQIFEVNINGSSPWYFYDWEHEIFIHAGKGEILHDGNWIPVTEGYVIFIPKHEEHQIRNTGNSTLVILSITPKNAS